MPLIVCVLVLYKETPTTCIAFKSFLASLAETDKPAFELVVYDNGPEDISELFTAYPQARYVHDGNNGMLVAAYNYGLQLARTIGSPWLMLLDQDTTITPQYLAESVALATQNQPNICAFLPRLEASGKLHSPHLPTGLDRPGEPFQGVCQQSIMAYNSGAILSVSRLTEMGGFSKEFPLDNLDYATFPVLQQTGQRTYIMKSVLEHSLSVDDMNTISLHRLKNKFYSDRLFERRFGKPTPVRTALRFLLTGANLLLTVKNKKVGWIHLRFAALCLLGKTSKPASA
jgi:GT2 family glycosyltransferase